MRGLLASLIVLAAWGCGRADERTQASVPALNQTAARPVTISGSTWLGSDGRPFEWRGITAFRLAELLATGRERDVIEYLDWARAERVTVVRVLLMAQHLFKLAPERGVAVLPRLLDLANARGVLVEVVALADTQGISFDMASHVRAVGRIAAEKGNAFIEIANEPGHPTQDPRVHDPAFVATLAALVPDAVPVSFGSVEYGDGYAAGDYVTFHSSRGTREWDHVTAAADGARLIDRFKKPVISDEPIGAASEYEPGRRDNEPARFAAAAALSRLAGVGATFHYEDGLQARVPGGREAECFSAWMSGLSLLVPEMKEGGEFLSDVRTVGRVSGARLAYARVYGGRALVLLLDPSPSATIEWTAPWAARGHKDVTGARLLTAERQ